MDCLKRIWGLTKGDPHCTLSSRHCTYRRPCVSSSGAFSRLEMSHPADTLPALPFRLNFAKKLPNHT